MFNLFYRGVGCEYCWEDQISIETSAAWIIQWDGTPTYDSGCLEHRFASRDEALAYARERKIDLRQDAF